MRLFIALELDKEIRDSLFKIKGRINPFAKINWVAKKNIHLTLKFLGEVTENKLEKIKNSLKEIKFKPFEIELKSRLGLFPPKGRINIIFVDIKNPVKIIELQQDIEDKLKDLFDRDERFSTHITLGRVKFVKDKDSFLKALKEVKVEEFTLKIENFSLIKSELTKDGSKYNVLGLF